MSGMRKRKVLIIFNTSVYAEKTDDQVKSKELVDRIDMMYREECEIKRYITDFIPGSRRFEETSRLCNSTDTTCIIMTKESIKSKDVILGQDMAFITNFDEDKRLAVIGIDITEKEIDSRFRTNYFNIYPNFESVQKDEFLDGIFSNRGLPEEDGGYPWFAAILKILPLLYGIWFVVIPYFSGFNTWIAGIWRKILQPAAIIVGILAISFGIWFVIIPHFSGYPWFTAISRKIPSAARALAILALLYGIWFVLIPYFSGFHPLETRISPATGVIIGFILTVTVLYIFRQDLYIDEKLIRGGARVLEGFIPFKFTELLSIIEGNPVNIEE